MNKEEKVRLTPKQKYVIGLLKDNWILEIGIHYDTGKPTNYYCIYKLLNKSVEGYTQALSTYQRIQPRTVNALIEKELIDKNESDNKMILTEKGKELELKTRSRRK